MSKYTYESDLRKYMGLDDSPSSKPLKLATGGSAKIRNDQYYADGGSTSEKKKDKKNELGAIIGGALAGVVGAGAAYMAYRNHKNNKQNAAGFNPHVGRHSHKAHGKNFIANPGYDENSGYNGSASGELGVSAARQAGEKMRENLRKMREKEKHDSSVMSNRPGGYKDEMNYDDFQNKYLDHYQDTESPAYQQKLRDFQKYGEPQSGILSIDHAKKKSLIP